ncbi:MAG: PAS domain S-box protein [Acidobacteria bacterium]|nr:PAS domain S-box protein [Acidobacteriota bacterium]
MAESVFRALDTSLVGAAVLDAQGRVTAANRPLCDLLHAQESNVLGRNWSEFSPEGEPFRDGLGWATDPGDGARVPLEKCLRGADGCVARVRIEARPFRDSGGGVGGVLILVQDLTQQGGTPALLANSEERADLMLAAVEQSPASIVITDTSGAIEYVNPKFSELTGYAPEEVLGANPRILKSGLQPDSVYEELWKTITAGGTWRGQFSNRRKDGTLFWEEALIGPIFRGGRIAHFLAVKEDITARRELELSQRRLISALEFADESVAVCTTDGRLIQANKAFHHILGCECEVCPTQGMEDGKCRLLRFFRGPGKEILDAIQEGGLTAAQPLRLRTTWIRNMEEKALALAISASLVAEPGGEGQDLLVVIRDVTQEKEMEKHLRQVEKMDALGALAGGIAHDFNNILTAILSSAELMDWKLPEDSPLRPKLQIILQAANRAKELNRRILTFSRPAEEKRIPFDLSAVVRECAQLLQNTLPRSVVLQVNAGSSIWTVGDPGQVHQVVMNLALNGFQALSGGRGKLEITLVEAPSTLVLEPSGEAGAMCAVLRIRDDGTGMEEAVLAKVFEPFFTTKDPGEGTGLGLSVVHGIVRQQGGRIHIESAPGRGTLVTVELPSAAAQPTGEKKSNLASVQGKEHLLVVDLEDVRVALTKEGLQTLGYHVTAKGHPREALDAFREHPAIFDAVILSYRQGPIPAEEVARSIRKLRPRIPILLASGSAAALEEVGRTETLFDRVVPKPFGIEQIGRALRETLDSKAPEQKPVLDPTPKAGTQRGAVLVAEDSAVTLSLLSSWLGKAGFTVFPARDGREAWEIFTERGASAFAMVLTDFVMPRMDGMQLVERIREVDGEIPLVLLSSNVEKESLAAALHLQVNEFLAKPFEAEALVACVERLLSGAGARKRSTETVQAVRRAQKALVAEPERDMPIYSVHQSLTDAGGDVFRCFKQADGSILFILADVAGHSVISSYAVAAFLGLLSSLVGDFRSPLQLARRLSRGILEGPFSEVPICAAIGFWTPATGRLHVLNAGLPHGLISGPSGCRRIALNGTPLGIFDQPLVEEKVLMLKEGDRILFGSDGVFEAQDGDGRFFEDSAGEAWCAVRTTLSVDAAVAHMADAARAMTGGVLKDDLLAVGFEQPALATGDLRVELDSSPEAIDAAVEQLEARVQAGPRSIPLTRSRAFDILTCAREALTNAAAHGNAGDPSKGIVLSAGWSVSPPSFRLAVVDEGLGFDLENLAPPEDPLSERGRGIPYIRHCASRVVMVGGELELVFEWEA